MTTTALTQERVLEALRTVVDPEMGLDLVALGLIYDVRIDGRRVQVKLTLTMPGCPMHDSITGGARLALLNLDEVDDAQVELVWDPPWHPGMMGAEAQALMG